MDENISPPATNTPATRTTPSKAGACNDLPKRVSHALSAAAPGAEVVGKALSVYWPADDAWYSGTVTNHNSSNGQHLVKYDDGEEEWVLLAHERVRWNKNNKGTVCG